MTYEIRKYHLPIKDGIIEVVAPQMRYLCDINEQNDGIYIWGIFNTDAEIVKHEFLIFGTGFLVIEEDFPRLSFIKTVHMNNGMVWHVGMIEKYCSPTADKHKEDEDLIVLKR